MSKLVSFVGVIVFLLLGAIPMAAQNASLVGTVRDALDALIPEATVTLTNTDTGVAQITRTDSAGKYEFSTVRPGNYSVKIEQSGFKTFVQSPVVLAVEQRARVDGNLQ